MQIHYQINRSPVIDSGDGVDDKPGPDGASYETYSVFNYVNDSINKL